MSEPAFFDLNLLSSKVMDPLLAAALSSWDVRIEVVIPLVIFGMLFITGWWRLRGRAGQRTDKSWRSLGAAWRPVSYISGLLVIALALVSPIDVLVQQLFVVHMLQHLLLIMIVPWLLLLPNPMPYLMWGLPEAVRLPVGQVTNAILSPRGLTGRALRRIATPGVMWFLLLISVYSWHDRNMYNYALQSRFIHDLEHIHFFAAGMIFWWYVIGAAPRIGKQPSRLARIALVVAAVPPNMGLGIYIAFSNEVLYTYYNDAPRLFGLSVLDDQRLSGFLMWVPGSMMYLLAALVLIAGLLKNEHAKPVAAARPWDNEELVAAPGMSRSGGRG